MGHQILCVNLDICTVGNKRQGKKGKRVRSGDGFGTRVKQALVARLLAVRIDLQRLLTSRSTKLVDLAPDFRSVLAVKLATVD